MRQERVMIPGPFGARVALDLYVANVSREIDLDVRRPALMICPGGGYQFLSEREAEPVAMRFLPEGFNCFVVWYTPDPADALLPRREIGAAVAWVRQHAEELHTNPDAIALIGFSAGAHAAGSLGVCWQQQELWQPLGLTTQQVKPNAMALCYPVITAGPFAHRSSLHHLTHTDDLQEHEKHSLEKLVTADCPPTFLWHTMDDSDVPMENSLLMAAALHKAGVPGELHIYPSGLHGLGLCNVTTAAKGLEDKQLRPDIEPWAGLAAAFLKKQMQA